MACTINFWGREGVYPLYETLHIILTAIVEHDTRKYHEFIVYKCAV